MYAGFIHIYVEKCLKKIIHREINCDLIFRMLINLVLNVHFPKKVNESVDLMNFS